MKPTEPLPDPLRDGPFSVSAAARYDVSDKRLRGRDLARPFHGVRAPDPPSNHLDRIEAYAVRLGEGEFFCGISAAAILGLPLPPGRSQSSDIDVGVPWPARAHRSEGISGHKLTIDEQDLCLVGRLPVTTAARTWCDLAVRLDLLDLVAAGDHIICTPRPLATVDDLAATKNRHPGRRGRGRLEEAFGLLDGASWSPAESIVRVTLVRAGIDGFVPNYPIADRRGTVWAYGDITFPEHRVIIEYQGDYHRDPEQWRKDRARIARLTAEGWHVLEIAANELRNQAELVRLVRAFLLLHPVRRDSP